MPVSSLSTHSNQPPRPSFDCVRFNHFALTLAGQAPLLGPASEAKHAALVALARQSIEQAQQQELIGTPDALDRSRHAFATGQLLSGYAQQILDQLAQKNGQGQKRRALSDAGEHPPAPDTFRAADSAFGRRRAVSIEPPIINLIPPTRVGTLSAEEHELLRSAVPPPAPQPAHRPLPPPLIAAPPVDPFEAMLDEAMASDDWAQAFADFEASFPFPLHAPGAQPSAPAPHADPLNGELPIEEDTQLSLRELGHVLSLRHEWAATEPFAPPQPTGLAPLAPSPAFTPPPPERPKRIAERALDAAEAGIDRPGLGPATRLEIDGIMRMADHLYQLARSERRHGGVNAHVKSEQTKAVAFRLDGYVRELLRNPID
jgi:hypothetical protein